jgi:YD repeat-containing protein
MDGRADRPQRARRELTYTTLPNGTQRLAGIARPEDGAFAFSYDGNDRVKRFTPPDSGPTSLVWDAENNRTAVIDALGHRHTTLYNASGQVSGTIDPLLNRTTTGRCGV